MLFFRFCRSIVFFFEKVVPYFEKILVIWLKHKQGKFPVVGLENYCSGRPCFVCV